MTANLLLAAFQGGMLLAQVARDIAPLKDAVQLAVEHLQTFATSPDAGGLGKTTAAPAVARDFHRYGRYSCCRTKRSHRSTMVRERQVDAAEELLQRATPSALLTLHGVIRSLNAAMATALGRPWEQCVGHGFVDLLSEDQRIPAESLLAHGATTKGLAMRVLEFPGTSTASVVCLVEARPVTDPSSGERLVWLHSLDARHDLGGLLIPFQLAAKDAGLGLWMCSPDEHQAESLGGAPALATLFPQASAPLSELIRRVHPDDRRNVQRLVRSSTARSPWIRSRFLTEHDGWRVLAGQTRRIQLGYGGPERVFAVIRDDTQSETHRQQMLAEVSAQRERADGITAFSSALFTAATEQELQQVVLARLAAAVGGLGALFAVVDDGRLRVSSDAGIPAWEADALHGLSLDEDRPLPCVIRTGQARFFPNHEELVRRWLHDDDLPLPHPVPRHSLVDHPPQPGGRPAARGLGGDVRQ